MTAEKAPRYKELDALRGLAALLVVMFHFTMHREQSSLGFNVGITGVDLFFIISGFVIFMSINHVSSTGEFIINRFTRLYPTYWTCVTFTFILSVIISKTNNTSALPFRDYLGNMTMFQQYLHIPDIDGPYWTMIIEMLFYIFIAILFSIKKIKYIVPVSLLVLYLIAIPPVISATPLWPAYLQLRMCVPLLNHFQLFFAGIVFYKIMTEKENHFLYAVFLLVAFTQQVISTDDKTGFINHSQHIMMIAIYFGVFILFVTKKLGFIVSRPTLFLGKISFALYLIHQFISTQVLLPFLLDKCHLNFWIAAVIALAVVITLSALITYYIEIPLGKRLNNWLRKVFKQKARV